MTALSGAQLHDIIDNYFRLDIHYEKKLHERIHECLTNMTDSMGLAKIKRVWESQLDAIQVPGGLNDPYTVLWGTPSINTGEVSVTDGIATVNDDSNGGVYVSTISLQPGRTGAAGVSYLLIRTLFQGAQLGPTSYFTFSAAEDNGVWTNTIPIAASVGEQFSLQIARDGSGHDSGGLYPFTPDAALTGWAGCPSARLRITKWFA